mmetsp:Transcript_4230/g.15849  ORF Transcript_4230/g.15849 Transcript_4230/m.15849 type:complete len:117 (+) Transcript_4230:775-1125(+)
MCAAFSVRGATRPLFARNLKVMGSINFAFLAGGSSAWPATSSASAADADGGHSRRRCNDLPLAARAAGRVLLDGGAAGAAAGLALGAPGAERNLAKAEVLGTLAIDELPRLEPGEG